jgi:hypothetical protein
MCKSVITDGLYPLYRNGQLGNLNWHPAFPPSFEVNIYLITECIFKYLGKYINININIYFNFLSLASVLPLALKLAHWFINGCFFSFVFY